MSRPAAKAGSRRQIALLGVLGVVLALALGKWSFSGSKAEPTARPAPLAAGDVESGSASPRPSGGRRAAAAPVSPDEVSLLSPDDLKPAGRRNLSGSDRDLFDLREPTQRPLPTPTPAPPPPPEPGELSFVGPLPPPPPTPTPAPPPIPFKFIGSFGPRERPIAVLSAGDRIVNARAGDVVFEHFILRKVGYESIDVGFEGFPESESKRLGIGQ